MTTVYVASPYGFSEATRRYHDNVLLPAVRAAGLEPLDPWADPDGAIAAAFAHADTLDAPARRTALKAINQRLAQANVERLDGCDLVLAVLDGTDVDSGVAAEVGYAAARGTPAVGLRLDFRLAGDNDGGVVNLQVEHFLVAVTRDLDAALDALRRQA